MNINKQKIVDPEPCPQMFEQIKKGMTEFNIYDLRTPQIMPLNTLQSEDHIQ
jgi:hypothetical protein